MPEPMGKGDPMTTHNDNPVTTEEMSVRCTRCRSEFTDAQIQHAKACPKCGTRGVPMSVAQDVTIKVNWHELRILTMWAERWADQVAKNDDALPDAQAVVPAIARAIQAQHPTMPPLTFAGEIAQVQEVYPEVEVMDGNGNVLIPRKQVH